MTNCSRCAEGSLSIALSRWWCIRWKKAAWWKSTSAGCSRIAISSTRSHAPSSTATTAPLAFTWLGAPLAGVPLAVAAVGWVALGGGWAASSST